MAPGLVTVGNRAESWAACASRLLLRSGAQGDGWKCGNDRRAAIDRHDRAGNAGRHIGSQKEDRFGDVGRLSGPSQRNMTAQRRPEALVERCKKARGANKARRDCVDPDIAWTQLMGSAVHEVVEGCLGDAISGLILDADGS